MSKEFIYEKIEDTQKLTQFLCENDGKEKYVCFNFKRNAKISCIGKKAFAYDSFVQRVILSKNIKTIEESAFENSSGLEILEAPCQKNGKIKELCVQYNAFKGCEKLKVVNLENVKKLHIEAFAFSSCSSLRVIVLPKKCLIDENAFSGCDKDKLCFIVKPNSSSEYFARTHEYRWMKNEGN